MFGTGPVARTMVTELLQKMLTTLNRTPSPDSPNSVKTSPASSHAVSPQHQAPLSRYTVLQRITQLICVCGLGSQNLWRQISAMFTRMNNITERKTTIKKKPLVSVSTSSLGGKGTRWRFHRSEAGASHAVCCPLWSLLRSQAFRALVSEP